MNARNAIQYFHLMNKEGQQKIGCATLTDDNRPTAIRVVKYECQDGSKGYIRQRVFHDGKDWDLPPMEIPEGAIVREAYIEEEKGTTVYDCHICDKTIIEGTEEGIFFRGRHYHYNCIMALYVYAGEKEEDDNKH